MVGSLGLGWRRVLGGVLTMDWDGREWLYNLRVNNAGRLPAGRRPRAPALRGGSPDALADALAPDVPGHRAAKEAITLLLAGGSWGVSTGRELSMLLLGDAYTADVLMEAAAEAAPDGMCAGVNDAADVLTDNPASRERAVEAGPAVLMDGGLLCVGGLDTVSAPRLAGLYDAAAGRVVSPPKSARWLGPVHTGVSLLASAEGARFAAGAPPPFDLVLDLRDGGMPLAPDEARPRDAPTPGDLAKYIAAVRGRKPELSQEAYGALDGLGGRAAEPRLVNTAALLAGAHAKMRLAGEITAADVRAAERVMRGSAVPKKQKKS